MNLYYIKNWIKILKIKKIPEPLNSVKIIFTEFGNIKYKNFNELNISRKKLNILQYRKISRKLYLRSFHFPIQYLVGYWEFRKIKVLLKPKILIPRIETIQIIDIVEDIFKNNFFNFFEIGLGSGNISLSLIKELYCSGEGCDIDKNSINLINKNKYFKKDKLKIYNSDFQEYLDLNNKKYDLIISNPPYITSKDYLNLEKQVKYYENYNALVSKDDGFYHCNIILNKCHKFLNPGGYIILELDPIQIKKIKNNENLLKIYSTISIIKDYFDKERFVVLKCK